MTCMDNSLSRYEILGYDKLLRVQQSPPFHPVTVPTLCYNPGRLFPCLPRSSFHETKICLAHVILRLSGGLY
jgi:hypothetical protein